MLLGIHVFISIRIVARMKIYNSFSRHVEKHDLNILKKNTYECLDNDHITWGP